MNALVPIEEELTSSSAGSWSPELDQFLSELALATRPFNLPRKASEKAKFLSAMSEAFEIIGGVPRLALWADKNEDKFYALYSKSIPGMIAQTNIQANGPVTIVTAVPESALDE